MPVYGVERYIERSAVSLFEQTYSHIEYVFVNDATPDRSIEILREVMNRYPVRQKDVRIIDHPKNKGISATRNTGLRAVTGDYIFYVDSDDYVDIQAIEKLVQYTEKSQADIVLFDTNVVSEKGIRCESVHWKDKVSYVKGLLQHTEKCAHWNKFYNAKFYLSTGVFADERIRLADDYAVTPRIIHQAQNIFVLHEPLYYYETRNQNSYVHNLTRSAIESVYQADTILVEYFKKVEDSSVYADVIASLSQRSLTSLLKTADRSAWSDLFDVYSACLQQRVGKELTLVYKVIFRLAQSHSTLGLRIFLPLYRFVMKCLQIC